MATTGWSRSVSFCATFRSQSISPPGPYLCFNHSFVFLKCPQSNYVYTHISPRAFKKKSRKGNLEEGKTLTKPLCALNGLGCTLFKTQCLSLLTPFILPSAGVPQAKNTTPLVRFLFTTSITFCVNFSHPFFEWLLARCALTVKQVLSKSTPRSAHGVKRPPRFGGGLKVG